MMTLVGIPAPHRGRYAARILLGARAWWCRLWALHAGWRGAERVHRCSLCRSCAQV